MSGFTFQFKFIKLSFSYDGLTIYDIKFPTYRGNFFEKSYTLIASYPNSKFVVSIHSDHKLYHQDGYDEKNEHSHIKFSSVLTIDLITEILEKLIEHNVISKEEKDNCLSALNLRYSNVRDRIMPLIKGSQNDDTKTIQKFILECQDNDILGYLHGYLSTPEFDYLRALTSEDKDSYWQSHTSSNHVVKTSKAWAMIEKTITIQLVNNIRTQCSKFTSDLGNEHADKLSLKYCFFSKKRKSTASKIENNTIGAFREGNEQKLQEKYEEIKQACKFIS